VLILYKIRVAYTYCIYILFVCYTYLSRNLYISLKDWRVGGD